MILPAYAPTFPEVVLSVKYILPSPLVADLTSMAVVPLVVATVNLRLVYAGLVSVPIRTWPPELMRSLSAAEDPVSKVI